MRLGITDTVKHLIIINVVMFIGTLAIGNGEAFYQWFALYFPKNEGLFRPWQIVTHMFMHGGPAHILFNMIGLWMFGSAVEKIFGAKKFLIFYLLSGLGAAIIMLAYYYFQYSPLEADIIASGFSQAEINHMLTTREILDGTTQAQVAQLQEMYYIFNSSMVGASGALFGVLVGFGMLYPNSEVMLIFLPIPIKAKYFIPGLIAINIFSEFSGHSILSPSNTAYMAHIGGALTGFLLMYFWKKNEKDKYRWN
ncbi:rhomboid family intramembrane serine protease [Winogradskyella echinorum]|uniref:Rhomboid family intramembrane serine protease n=1 Tax=Winogradskyella echinorum TaxID=538189 RepID=A0ABR6Y2D5_9FLAO|nr:rhomboid family intramembrane serine protease [Winogradskyella echinorum]MBC3846909.1 rhomboid family intramembrane serine protease [Winogradskyella echinorum]MBC5751257.1 rhomboid family intramembrane serine protease [Winogradskyella echinorum]